MVNVYTKGKKLEVNEILQYKAQFKAAVSSISIQGSSHGPKLQQFSEFTGMQWHELTSLDPVVGRSRLVLLRSKNVSRNDN